MSSRISTKTFTFGAFCLDAVRHLLTRDTGEAVPLTPKAFELLLLLVASEGRLMTKAELMNRMWPDSFVEEGNLTQTISVLRKALGENPHQHQYIVTVPGQGYQFIAPVSEVFAGDEILEESILYDYDAPAPANPPPAKSAIRHPQPAIRWRWLAGLLLVVLLACGAYWFYPLAKPASLREIKTLAVLPFEDLSAEPAERYLGVSLADALAGKFSNLKQITVRPTRAVLKYAGQREDLAKIGRELQVDAVLDGRIQRAGGRIRVSAQLIRTADNAVLWAGSFDDQFTNFFSVQDSISQKVAQSLAWQMNEKERLRFNRRGTENAEAYQEYQLGRFFWHKRTAGDLDRAIRHFNRAIELDGSFAQAHAGLAETHAIYPFYAVTPDKESLPKARVAATCALELDGDLAEAHTVLAYVQSQYDFDWPGAEKSYLRALELNPNHANTRQWYGEFLVFQGRFGESLEQMHQAVALDPASLSANAAPALAYNASRQFAQALETTARVLQMDANFVTAQHYQARALFFSGRRAEAFEVYRKILAQTNDSLFFKADFGFMHGKAGNQVQARKILTELTATAKEKYVSPYHFANVHLGLNEREKAFAYLRQAVAERDNNVIVLKVGLNFDDVRDDPQFQEILRSANF